MSERVCSTGGWVLLWDLEGGQKGEFSQLLWEARLPSIHPDCCAFTLGLELSRALPKLHQAQEEQSLTGVFACCYSASPYSSACGDNSDSQTW